MGLLLGVERKFLFSFKKLHHFHQNKGVQPFKSLVFHGCKAYRDVYYDTPDLQLDKQNTWVRKRNGRWEAKFLKAGIHTAATYQEAEGPLEVARMLKVLGYVNLQRANANGSFGLAPFMEFVTARREYTADERFTVVLDTTDFGHSVGEVELMGEDGEACHREINEFMEKHKWFFEQEGQVIGKCRAYLQVFPR